MTTDGFRYAYLHGFASSPAAKKAVLLGERFAARGVRLDAPDLNLPSFARLSLRAAREEITRYANAGGPGGRVRFVASSMGGLLAAWWAAENPERIDRLVLLCPAFDLAGRWPTILGAERIARWEREGTLEIADASGALVPVHHALALEAREAPRFPEAPRATVIVHGKRDETVPVALSRAYVAVRPHVRLVEVDDDHSLHASVDVIAEEAFRFFEI